MKILTFIFTSAFLFYQVLSVRLDIDDSIDDDSLFGVRPYFDDRVEEKISPIARFHFDDRTDSKILYGESLARSLNDQLMNFLEYRLRSLMRNGNASMGIPILDVYQKDQQTLELNMKEVMLDGQLFDLTVVGLSNYTVIDGVVNLFPPKVIISMNFPEIRANGFYVFKGEVLETIPLFGEGKFDVVVNDFFYNAEVAIGLDNDLVKSLNLKIALGKLKLDVIGLFNDENISRLFSQVVSDMAPNFIRICHDKIVEFAEPQLVKSINEQLKGYSLSDLMEMLE